MSGRPPPDSLRPMTEEEIAEAVGYRFIGENVYQSVNLLEAQRGHARAHMPNLDDMGYPPSCRCPLVNGKCCNTLTCFKLAKLYACGPDCPDGCTNSPWLKNGFAVRNKKCCVKLYTDSNGKRHPRIGYVLVATEDIYYDEYVDELTGMVYGNTINVNPERARFMSNISLVNQLLDSSERSSAGRQVVPSCRPNTIAVQVMNRATYSLVFKASRHIERGEIITRDISGGLAFYQTVPMLCFCNRADCPARQPLLDYVPDRRLQMPNPFGNIGVTGSMEVMSFASNPIVPLEYDETYRELHLHAFLDTVSFIQETNGQLGVGTGRVIGCFFNKNSYYFYVVRVPGDRVVDLYLPMWLVFRYREMALYRLEKVFTKKEKKKILNYLLLIHSREDADAVKKEIVKEYVERLKADDMPQTVCSLRQISGGPCLGVPRILLEEPVPQQVVVPVSGADRGEQRQTDNEITSHAAPPEPVKSGPRPLEMRIGNTSDEIQMFAASPECFVRDRGQQTSNIQRQVEPIQRRPENTSQYVPYCHVEEIIEDGRGTVTGTQSTSPRHCEQQQVQQPVQTEMQLQRMLVCSPEGVGCYELPVQPQVMTLTEFPATPTQPGSMLLNFGSPYAPTSTAGNIGCCQASPELLSVTPPSPSVRSPRAPTPTAGNIGWHQASPELMNVSPPTPSVRSPSAPTPTAGNVGWRQASPELMSVSPPTPSVRSSPVSPMRSSPIPSPQGNVCSPQRATNDGRVGGETLPIQCRQMTPVPPTPEQLNQTPVYVPDSPLEEGSAPCYSFMPDTPSPHQSPATSFFPPAPQSSQCSPMHHSPIPVTNPIDTPQAVAPSPHQSPARSVCPPAPQSSQCSPMHHSPIPVTNPIDTPQAVAPSSHQSPARSVCSPAPHTSQCSPMQHSPIPVTNPITTLQGVQEVSQDRPMDLSCRNKKGGMIDNTPCQNNSEQDIPTVSNVITRDDGYNPKPITSITKLVRRNNNKILFRRQFNHAIEAITCFALKRRPLNLIEDLEVENLYREISQTYRHYYYTLMPKADRKFFHFYHYRVAIEIESPGSNQLKWCSLCKFNYTFKNPVQLNQHFHLCHAMCPRTYACKERKKHHNRVSELINLPSLMRKHMSECTPDLYRQLDLSIPDFIVDATSDYACLKVHKQNRPLQLVPPGLPSMRNLDLKAPVNAQPKDPKPKNPRRSKRFQETIQVQVVHDDADPTANQPTANDDGDTATDGDERRARGNERLVLVEDDDLTDDEDIGFEEVEDRPGGRIRTQKIKMDVRTCMPLDPTMLPVPTTFRLQRTYTVLLPRQKLNYEEGTPRYVPNLETNEYVFTPQSREGNNDGSIPEVPEVPEVPDVPDPAPTDEGISYLDCPPGPSTVLHPVSSQVAANLDAGASSSSQRPTSSSDTNRTKKRSRESEGSSTGTTGKGKKKGLQLKLPVPKSTSTVVSKDQASVDPGVQTRARTRAAEQSLENRDDPNLLEDDNQDNPNVLGDFPRNTLPRPKKKKKDYSNRLDNFDLDDDDD